MTETLSDIYAKTHGLPKMIPVESSHVKKIGYADTDLYVEFNKGLYVYKSVPEKVFIDLLNADSKGHFITENIIKNNYNYDYLI